MEDASRKEPAFWLQFLLQKLNHFGSFARTPNGNFRDPVNSNDSLMLITGNRVKSEVTTCPGDEEMSSS